MTARSRNGRNSAERAPATTGTLAVGAAVPDELPALGADSGVPLGRSRPEARGEAVEELRGQGDLRQQDQRLPPGAQRRRDRLEIDLRLARSRDALQQGHARVAGEHAVAQGRRRDRLLGRQVRRGEIGIGAADDRLRGEGGRLESAFGDKRGDDGGGAGGGGGQRRLAPDVAALRQRQHPLARGRLAAGRRTAVAHAETRCARPSGERRADAHAQDHAARAERPARDPVDKGAPIGRQRGQVAAGASRFQLAHRGAAARPDHADGAARSQRHFDEIAGGQRRIVGDAVGVGLIDGDRDQDVGGGDGLGQGKPRARRGRMITEGTVSSSKARARN